jgi:hypothetical protein
MPSNLWKLVMKNKSALFAGVLAGITSPATIYTQTTYHALHGTDVERLRNDVSRIGNDFSTVIERENGKEQTSTSST